MTKEEVVQEIKNGIVDCMSLIDEENIDECADRILNLCRMIVFHNQVTVKGDLLALIDKTIDKSDVRIQKLNDLVNYIETTLRYTENTGNVVSNIENYIDHITKVEELDEMDRCYILTKMIRDKRVSYYAVQIIARGLFKSIKY